MNLYFQKMPNVMRSAQGHVLDQMIWTVSPVAQTSVTTSVRILSLRENVFQTALVLNCMKIAPQEHVSDVTNSALVAVLDR